MIAAEDSGPLADDPAGVCTGGESFTPGTDVVMANGTLKPIDQIRAGDKVKATNPKTGKTTARRVTKVWVNHDTDLMNVIVAANGATSVIHTTRHHLFWDATQRSWVKADTLAAGDRLRQAGGTLATFKSVTNVGGGADMWDLTVSRDHDFYIETAAASVLVHNNSCPNLDALSQSGASLDPSDAGGALTRAGRAYAKAGEVFGPTAGGPAAINDAGQQALDEILTNPDTNLESVTKGNFAGGYRFVSPSGTFAVFGPDGTFQYFGQ